jgi:pimeloyl-ACP methyl ester carboxylesterase
MLSIVAVSAKAIVEASHSFPSERIEFASRRGNLLVGDLHRAGRQLGPTLVLCHGMESTRQGTKQQAIVERFLPLGISVLRFDFSYVGESEGRFEELTVTGEVDDALGALDFLQEFAPSKVVLVGSSLGGAVALLAAARTPERVHAVATIAAVADTALFTESLSAADVEEWRRTGRRRWREGYLNVDFLDDVQQIDIPLAVAILHQPVLVMHGEDDAVVPPAHAAVLAAAAGGEVTLAMFPGVGHRFEEEGALDGLLDRLQSWLERVLK